MPKTLPAKLAELPIVVIPAYKPTGGLPEISAAIIASERVRAVVIVNDGSGPEWESRFAALAGMAGVSVLNHFVNLGKGAALKTGLNYAACNFPESIGVVTADADGEHTVKDVLRTADALREEPLDLVLGARSFAGPVPFRGRLVNRLTGYVLRAVTGQKISDAQTGLRGIPMGFVPTLMRLRPTGYDFELEMLLACKLTRRHIREIEIETSSIEGFRSSHFNPLLDSTRIYFLLLRFAAVSMSTALLDNVVFIVSLHLCGNLLASQAVGRLTGGLFNYYVNKNGVFHAQVRDARALPKYWTSLVLLGIVSYGLINLLISIGFSIIAAKLCAESILFVFSFIIQRDVVFAPKKTAA